MPARRGFLPFWKGGRTYFARFLPTLWENRRTWAARRPVRLQRGNTHEDGQQNIRADDAKGLATPRFVKDCLWAFFVGGAICLLGEVLRQTYLKAGYTLADAGTLTSVTLVALSAVTTALGWYQKLASKAGAGTLVPITGFANAVVSPAIEFRNEGLVTGVGAKMFIIAGPVIVYGMLASVVWGVIYWAIRPLLGG